MPKFKSPLNSKELWISQSSHGESASNPDDLSKQCAVDISANGGQYVYSVSEGIVELVTTSLGSYVSIIPTNAKFRILYVHVDNFFVKKGDKVKVGTKIAKIKKMTGSHLHFGLKNISGKAPHPCPMDYFDRSLVFRTKYKSIKDIWFIGENLNWKLFKDLHYKDTPKPENPPQPPVVPSNCEKQEKEILDLKQKIDTLEHELGAKNGELNVKNAEVEELKESLTEIGDKFTTLSIEKNRIENDYNKSVEELNLIKTGRFFWVLGFLEKLFPKRK